jgi:hypothetical protein
LFERSDDFINSDIKFISENDLDSVEIDESLFQNMEEFVIDDAEEFKIDHNSDEE